MSFVVRWYAVDRGKSSSAHRRFTESLCAFMTISLRYARSNFRALWIKIVLQRELTYSRVQLLNVRPICLKSRGMIPSFPSHNKVSLQKKIPQEIHLTHCPRSAGHF